MKTLPFDGAKYLTTSKAEAELLADAFELGDPAYVVHAFGVIARSRGLAQIADQAGLTRDALFEALADPSDPTASPLLAVAEALGMRLKVAPAAE